MNKSHHLVLPNTKTDKYYNLYPDKSKVPAHNIANELIIREYLDDLKPYIANINSMYLTFDFNMKPTLKNVNRLIYFLLHMLPKRLNLIYTKTKAVVLKKIFIQNLDTNKKFDRATDSFKTHVDINKSIMSIQEVMLGISDKDYAQAYNDRFDNTTYVRQLTGKTFTSQVAKDIEIEEINDAYIVHLKRDATYYEPRPDYQKECEDIIGKKVKFQSDKRLELHYYNNDNKKLYNMLKILAPYQKKIEFTVHVPYEEIRTKTFTEVDLRNLTIDSLCIEFYISTYDNQLRQSPNYGKTGHEDLPERFKLLYDPKKIKNLNYKTTWYPKT